nr:hypothetical protein [bacterium]
MNLTFLDINDEKISIRIKLIKSIIQYQINDDVAQGEINSNISGIKALD